MSEPVHKAGEVGGVTSLYHEHGEWAIKRG